MKNTRGPILNFTLRHKVEAEPWEKRDCGVRIGQQFFFLICDKRQAYKVCNDY